MYRYSAYADGEPHADPYVGAMDGRSFAQHLLHPSVGPARALPAWKDAALIEYQSIYGGATGMGVRTWPSAGALPGLPLRCARGTQESWRFASPDADG